ncbi:MAG: hypothetical protein FWD68_09770, partial [Alphaproteobacteria bacterium]|nr:hypothetical protein [Alphaproteobacteria bacterium]
IWTKEEDNIILRERAARTAVPAIAAMLDRPVPATYLRARKLGTLVQPHKAASEEEKRIVRALAERDPPATDNEIAAATGRTAGSVRWLLRVMGLVNSRDFAAMIRHANKGRVQARPAVDREARLAAAEARAARAQAARLEKEANRKAACAARAAAARERKLERGRQIAEARSARLEQAAALKEARAQAALQAREARSQQAMAARAEKAAASVAVRARQLAEREAAQAELVAAREQAHRELKAAREQAKAQARAGRAAAKAANAVASVVQAHASLNAARSEQPALAAAAPIVLYDPALRDSVVDRSVGAVVQTSGRGGWKQVFGTHRKLPRGTRVRARADDLALAEAAKDAIAAFIADRGVTRKVESPVELAIRKLRTRGYTVLGNGPGYTIDARHHLANDNELLRFAEQRGAA